MRVTQGLICLSLVPSFSVLAASAQEKSAEVVDAGLKSMLVLSEFLKPEDKEVVQEDLRAAAVEALRTKDKVLLEVYQQLFKFGSALREDVAAYGRLRRALARPAEEVPAEALFEITESCAASETLLERIVAQIKERMDTTISAVAAEEKQKPSEVFKRYAPLTAFLNTLHTSLRLRMGQARIIQAKRALEGAFLQGKLEVEEAISSLNEKLGTIYLKLQAQDEQLLTTAREAYKAGVLFKAAFSFIYGLARIDGAL
ncbi:hypothetical protein Emag_002963 [Eimeria magna]